MNKITAVIIAKNEESTIDACLESVAFCDEIILVDNNSSDKTVEIAKKRGVKIISFTNKNFADLRNKGLENVSSEWVLYIDADERVDKELEQNIKLVIGKNDTEYSGYRVLRKNYYLGKNEWPHIEKLERLFKKEDLEKWYGELHESPVVSGKIGELSGFLLHFTHRNLEYMLQKTIVWSDVEARLRLEAGHPKMSWWRFYRVMLSSFVSSYIVQGGYKLGTVGIIESVYQSFSMFITYAKLWELQNKRK